jgi:hypothetical protein
MTHLLSELTKKDTLWRGGPLPSSTLKAFNELKGYLSFEQVVDYAWKHRPYNWITRCSPDKGSIPKGLSAILTQTNDQGNHSVLAYASLKHQKHEKLQVAVWSMDHALLTYKYL